VRRGSDNWAASNTQVFHKEKESEGAYVLSWLVPAFSIAVVQSYTCLERHVHM
jgi:hypothetical protein